MRTVTDWTYFLFALSLFVVLGCGDHSTVSAKDAGSRQPTDSGTLGAVDVESLKCSQWASGCVCGTTQKAELDRCSMDSLTTNKPPQDEVVCCAVGTASCICTQLGCRDIATQGSCVCQPSVDDGSGAIASCPARSGSTCCLYNMGPSLRCTCSPSPCTAGQQTVSSCSVADVAVCSTGYVQTTACK